jgi:MerR family transcriptional regulator/heat shock protein HspR
MSERRTGQFVVRGRASARLEEPLNPEPRYEVTVVAARTGVQIATIRRYEEIGLVEAITVQSGTRLYSDADIDRIRRARRLIDDLGVNLAGAAAILHLREQLVALQREFQMLRDRSAGS